MWPLPLLIILSLFTLTTRASGSDVCSSAIYAQLAALADYTPAQDWCDKYYPTGTVTYLDEGMHAGELRIRLASDQSAYAVNEQYDQLLSILKGLDQATASAFCSCIMTHPTASGTRGAANARIMARDRRTTTKRDTTTSKITTTSKTTTPSTSKTTTKATTPSATTTTTPSATKATTPPTTTATTPSTTKATTTPSTSPSTTKATTPSTTPSSSKTTTPSTTPSSSSAVQTTTTTCQSANIISSCSGNHVAGQASTTYYSGCCSPLVCSTALNAGVQVASCASPAPTTTTPSTTKSATSSSSGPPASTVTTCLSNNLGSGCSSMNVAGQGVTTTYTGCCSGYTCTSTVAGALASCQAVA